MKKRYMVGALAITLSAFALSGGCEDSADVRIATFNVENYPKHDLQRTKVPKVIGELDVPIVALQEAIDVKALESDVQKQLGNQWVLASSQQGGKQKLGVLYDSTEVTLLSKRDYSETIIYPNARPAFEARFKQGDETVRVLVLHLKAGGKFYALRAAQWWALLPIIERGMDSEDALVVVGDFNATGWADRLTIWALSMWTGTRWISRGVECSHYWSREDDCVTSALDHALTSSPGTAKALGACEDVGCSNSDRCPIWRDEVSDHCPVVLDLD